MNKLGSYITKLMTTIIDSEQEQFVIDLALTIDDIHNSDNAIKNNKVFFTSPPIY